eukprot:Opistho-2@66278
MSNWMVCRLYKFIYPDVVQKEEGAIRIGVLGAANIAPMALVTPAKQVPGAVVAGVAARDRTKAEAFAKKHAIPKVYDSYQAILDDPAIDAVYIPLPNSHHKEWTLKALAAGKHVLCEKPIANNEEEARDMDEAGRRSGKVLMEAFHYRYHPAIARLRQVLDGGHIGDVQRAEARFIIPWFAFGKDDIRFQYELGGGSLMDNGCYVVDVIRLALGDAPFVGVKSAHATSTVADRVDAGTIAELEFEGGKSARMECALSGPPSYPSVTIQGSKGKIEFSNFVAPFVSYKMTTTLEDGKTITHQVYGEEECKATYVHQLRAFVAAVKGDRAANITPADAGVRNMRIIDAIYTASGLGVRGKPLATPPSQQ